MSMDIQKSSEGEYPDEMLEEWVKKQSAIVDTWLP